MRFEGSSAYRGHQWRQGIMSILMSVVISGSMALVIMIGPGALNVEASPAQAASVASTLMPCDLRCDDAAQPLGIDDLHPRLGWKLQAQRPENQNRGENHTATRSVHQTAYRIAVASDLKKLDADRADLWDSGERPASRLPYALYEGKPLHTGQRVYWKVRIRDERGHLSPWSGPQTWEMGLLQPQDWHAKWITTGKIAPATEREMFADDPAPLLRKEFVVRRPIVSARVYVSGLGYYELRLNGAKVGDHQLDPGWTDYAHRVLYATYDVTAQLQKGDNTLGIMLGNGWYNPLPLRMWGHLNLREHLTIGQPRAIARMEITYKDGSRQTIMTDESWRWHDGPILRNSVYLGEVYDGRKALTGWDTPHADIADWHPAQIATAPVGPLCAQTAPPIRITRTVRPVKITTPTSGVTIVDMGQNFAGWVRLRLPGSSHATAGTRITLRYGELLRPDGTLNPMTSVAGQIKGRRVERESEAPSTAWQRDIYIMRGSNGDQNSGQEEVYTPRFTFHGFRYVEITGLLGKANLDTLTGLRLNSDVEPVGTFQCSNETFNRIQEVVRWTEQSNLFSVQSDCPHREKFGYGGDIVAASEMALLNYDMSRFYAKTVQDYADAARPDGGLTETAPFVGIADAGLGRDSGPVEWGTAHPLLLMQLYRYYGNLALIEAQYAMAQRWFKLLQANAKDDILDNGIGDHEGLHRPPTALTGTAFYYANATLMAQLADILGRKAEAQTYRIQADRIKKAFYTRFDPQQLGRFAEGSESSQAFALYYGLVPPAQHRATLDTLVQEVLDNRQGHLDTGIFGTKYLLSSLSDAGRADVAATIVGQSTFPGWGHMLANGATTLWEHWDFSDNTFSHNHPMFGSVSEWFYKTLAGIAPAPDAIGFDHILIHPQPVGGVKWARGAYRSVRGTISTDWAQRPDGFHLTVTIPPNARALVTLPADGWKNITEGGKPLTSVSDIRRLTQQNDVATLEIGSGTYRFRVAK